MHRRAFLNLIAYLGYASVAFIVPISATANQLTKVQILIWQDYLSSIGYELGPSDGIIGPKTRKAISEQYGINQDEYLLDTFKNQFSTALNDDVRIVSGFNIDDYFERKIVHSEPPLRNLTDVPEIMQTVRWSDGFAYFAILQVADFNNDGYSDLLTSTGETGRLPQILINDKNGGFFTASISGDLSRFPGCCDTRASVGDLNNDNVLDVAFGSGRGGTSGQNIFYFSNGNNGYEISLSQSILTRMTGLTQSYQQVYIHDFNEDGYDDLLELTTSHRERDYPGGGNSQRYLPSGVYLSDQGKLEKDIITQIPQFVSEMMGRDNPNKASPNSSESFVRFADIDLDGHNDMLIGATYKSDPSLAENAYLKGGPWIQFMDGDADFSNDEFIRLKNHWSYFRWDEIQDVKTSDEGWAFASWEPSIIDVNLDGLPDILIGQQLLNRDVQGTGGGFRFYLNLGERKFEDRTDEFFPNRYYNEMLGLISLPDIVGAEQLDVNGDGNLDILFTQGNILCNDDMKFVSNLMLNVGGVYLPVEKASLGTLCNPETAYGGFNTGDFNGDGLKDFVVVAPTDNQGNPKHSTAATRWTIFVYLNRGERAVANLQELRVNTASLPLQFAKTAEVNVYDRFEDYYKTGDGYLLLEAASNRFTIPSGQYVFRTGFLNYEKFDGKIPLAVEFKESGEIRVAEPETWVVMNRAGSKIGQVLGDDVHISFYGKLCDDCGFTPLTFDGKVSDGYLLSNETGPNNNKLALIAANQ